MRSRLRARAVFAVGKHPRPCRICSAAFCHKYRVDCIVYHGKRRHCAQVSSLFWRV